MKPSPAPSTSTSAEGLRQGIGRFDALALVVGSMVGSGIFIVSAESARLLRSAPLLLAVWTVAGLLTLAAAVSCAELAAMLPRAGGQYVFFREAYGPLAGFLFGWAMLLVIQTGTIAAVAAAFARFLAVFLPRLSDSSWGSLGPLAPTPQRLVAIGVVVLLTATNATGLRAGTVTQNVFTTLKLAALLALALGGLLLGTAGAAEPAAVSLSPPAFALVFAAALVGPFFSQTAWNNVTFAGEEVREPGRNLPRALLLGCLIVTAAYVATNAAYLRTLGLSGIATAPQDRVGTAAAGALFGPAGALAMAAAILVSTFGCVNGLILSGARVSYAMARDGHFFSALARLNRAAVPANALWLQAAWASLLVLSGTYSQLLRYVVSADLLLYVLLVLAVPVLRRKAPDAPRPFRAPGYPWLQLAYAGCGLAVIVLLLLGNPRTTWPGYVLLVSGVPVFLFWRRRESR
ncbi:MAG TPA: amino acid permease [Thermoanaerobaculia bacterium]